ncbi:MAG: hypothetical protein QM747_00765 [Nocardioides sp.]
MSFAGRTAADTGSLFSALRQWSADGPGGATVSMVGGRVQVTSCDPGTSVSSGGGNAMAALNLVATRNGLQNGIMHAGSSAPLSHCLAGKLIATYSVAQLNSSTFGANDPTVQDRVRQMALACQ